MIMQCPICKSDAKGNNKIRYYCRQCNLMFQDKDFGIFERIDSK